MTIIDEVYKTFRFGVCCVFMVSEGGKEVSQNCTYVRNPGFPAAYADTTMIQHMVRKCDESRLHQENVYIHFPDATYSHRIS